MRIEFEINPNFVQFPVDDKEFVKVPRPVVAPLHEVHGEMLHTIGYDEETKLLAYQVKERPHRICWAYPVEKAIYLAFIHDLGMELDEKEIIDFIIGHYLVCDEPCNVYKEDHGPVNENLKEKKDE